jgi:ribosomal protein S18 acetylase RimI-like enzyme
MSFLVTEATGEPAVAVVRDLFREYEAWLGVDLCFQGFAAELAGLPGDYAPPSGRLLLASAGADRAAGCVALRALDAERCEMKRLYVRPAHQGSGLGRTLVTTLIEEARGVGYRAMLLDTLPQMRAAQHLYESLGFRDVEPYRYNPYPGTRFLQLDL